MDGDQAPAAGSRDAVVAGSLMRMALALLDRAGESAVAARLQHALDTLDRRSCGPPTQAELDRFEKRFDRRSR